MPAAVHRVSGGMRLAFICCLIHLLKWPDWQLPALFVKGFNVVNEIPESNIFRSRLWND